MFEALGLNRTCELVYLSMFATPTGDTATLARRLDMDEARLGTALADLEQLSLIRRSADDPERVWLNDPDAGLATLLARQHAEAARRQQEIEESRTGLVTLWTMHLRHHSASPEPAVERLPADSAWQGLRALLESGPREMSVLTPRVDPSGPDPLGDRALICNAITRGMRSRTICLSSVRNDPAAVGYAHQLQDCGAEVRTAPTLPLRMMVVVDRRTVIVPSHPDDPSGMTLRVSGTSLTTALLALFNRLWREAAPLGTARRRTGEGLSSQDKAVLKLLGAGHTDEVVARRLGISVRSTRRIVAGLLARLNARSRFQAGLLAASRSWLELDELD